MSQLQSQTLNHIPDYVQDWDYLSSETTGRRTSEIQNESGVLWWWLLLHTWGFFFSKWRLSHAHQFHSLGQDSFITWVIFFITGYESFCVIIPYSSQREIKIVVQSHSKAQLWTLKHSPQVLFFPQSGDYLMHTNSTLWARISPQWLSKLRWPWWSIPWPVLCKLISLISHLTIDSIVSPVWLHWVKGEACLGVNLPPALFQEWLSFFLCVCVCVFCLFVFSIPLR